MSDIAAQATSPAGSGSSVDAEVLLERRDVDRADPDHTGLYPPRNAGRSTRMIGEVVVDLGFSDKEAVEAAVQLARTQGRPTGLVLVEQGVLKHDQLARVVAERFGLDFVDLSVFEVDMGAVSLLTPDACQRYRAVPIGFTEDNVVLLAMADPTNVLTLDDVGMMTGRRVKPVAASLEDLGLLLTRLAHMDSSIEDIVDDAVEPEEVASTRGVEDSEDDAPIIKFVHSIVAQAVQRGASDIHVNPEEGDARVLFRVDGVLSNAATIKRKMAMGVVSRIKIMGDLDISEKRAPQDGRFALTVDGRRVDVRVATLPVVNGEAAVLRILDKGTSVQGLESLGMGSAELERFSAAIRRPNGAVLVTGPTGSGKSTTLYGALAALNNGERSIITIEDPVEQRIAGIKQMQIAPKAGVTFDLGLRSILRADPDVIMVGEVRDPETAHIAVEAALTGHLVLATLHTRDAPSALGRLMDMGIEPFLVSSAVDCIVAQRLLRVLCDGCKRPQKVSKAVLTQHGLAGAEPFEPVGCKRCGGTGYRGRVGVYEVLPLNEQIRALILERAPVDAMVEVAEREGMRRLRDDGLEKVRAGVTSIAEVERMTASML
jgi:type IV pilus assembly protein PilB